MIAFPQIILGFFIVEAATLRQAILPLQIGIPSHVVEGYSKILDSALIGAGATDTVFKLSTGLQ